MGTMKEPNIGGRIKQLREALRLSQVAFAQSTGTPLDTLKKYEGSKRLPGSDALMSMATTGVNLHWLITGVGPVMLKDSAPHPRTTDTEMLRIIIEAIEEHLDDAGRAMLPAKKADVVTALYDIYVDTGKTVDKPRLIHLLKSAA